MRRTNIGAAIAPLAIELAIRLALLFVLLATFKSARRAGTTEKPADAGPSASTPSPPFRQGTAAARYRPARR